MKSMKVRLIDRNHPTPLYHQVKNILVDLILTRELKPKDQLPAEALLAEQYGVSKATIRQALGELEQEGFLYRMQGRGTFVAIPPVDLGPSHLDSFTLQMKERGFRSSSQVIEQVVIPAEDELAEKMSVSEGARLLRLKRLRFANDEPMGIQTSHIPLDLAPGLEERDFRKETSLYAVLRESHGLIPVRAHETHWAVRLEKEQAEILGTEPGAAALSSRRLTLLMFGRPMEFVISLMRGDRYKVVLELSSTRTATRTGRM